MHEQTHARKHAHALMHAVSLPPWPPSPPGGKALVTSLFTSRAVRNLLSAETE